MKYSHNNIYEIIKNIDDETSRWDAILDLKVLNDSKYLSDFITASYHKNWIVRWVIVEKLAQFKHPNIMKRLVDLLDDPDPHVRKNVIKSINHYGNDILTVLSRKLLHHNYKVRILVKQIFYFMVMKL